MARILSSVAALRRAASLRAGGSGFPDGADPGFCFFEVFSVNDCHFDDRERVGEGVVAVFGGFGHASADEAGDFVFAEFFAEIRELLPAVVDEAGSRFLAGGEAKDMHLLRRDGKWFKCH
ncbi:MAG: hypothetical protein ACK6DY_05695 [Acidobacteriota bacterium]|jgi:hypothetical protein|nr:hypothetical protein [Bryobacteraceae bacterium CoA2 C42]